MAEGEKTPAKKRVLKGGRKGGTTFPRINLERALQYADKLVSKTHTGALPATTILAGVFENAGPEGQVRASALKQYGLLEGDKSAYKASPLAQAIDAALPEEKSAHLQKAFLTSKLFQEIFETFQDDTVSRAKIRQRAQALKVHPDSSEECTGIFMESAVTAGLGSMNGDTITLVKAGTVVAPPAAEDEEIDDNNGSEELDVAGTDQAGAALSVKTGDGAQEQEKTLTANKSVVTVNLTVDSSSDPDKLEKQLKLLKQFGLV